MPKFDSACSVFPKTHLFELCVKQPRNKKTNKKLHFKSYSNSKMKQRPIVGLFIFYEIKQINDLTSSNKNDPICFIFEVFSSVRVVVSDPILLVKNQNVMTMILIDGRWERFSLPFGWNSLYSNRVVNYRKRYHFRDFYCQAAHGNHTFETLLNRRDL